MNRHPTTDTLAFNEDTKLDPINKNFKQAIEDVASMWELRPKQSLEEASKALSKQHKGLRYNDGKLRYDLLHPYAEEQLAKIFTMGANKYAARNWEKGMSWTGVIASLKRHLLAIEKGEDYDPESGLLHAAHVMWNAHALTAYYKIYPQGDDHPHGYLNLPKVGLDIDGVLADFTGHLLLVGKVENHTPMHWNDPVIRRLFDQFKDDEQFWLDIPPLIKPTELGFEPHCYITARSIGEKVCKQWLDRHGLPTAKVYALGNGESKIDTAKQAGMDIFIDDNYTNFIELNKAGVCTLLYTAPYNFRYDVGHKRLNNFKDSRKGTYDASRNNTRITAK